MAQKKKTKKIRSKAMQKQDQHNELMQWITLVIIAALMIIGLMRTGAVGILLYNILRFLFGDRFYVVMGVAVLWFLISIAGLKQDADDKQNPIPMILFVLDLLLLWSYNFAGPVTGIDAMAYLVDGFSDFFAAYAVVNAGGGLVGSFLYAVVSLLFGRQGTVIVMITMLVIATVLMGMMDVYKNAFFYVVNFFRTPEKEEVEEEPVEEKDAPNLWRIIQEHTENTSKRAVFIKADDPIEDQPLKDVQNQLDRGEEVTVRFKPRHIKPQTTSSIDIRVDDDDCYTDELHLLSDNRDFDQTLKMQKVPVNDSIFINVDDLVDNVSQPEEGTADDLSMYRDYENDSYEDAVEYDAGYEDSYADDQDIDAQTPVMEEPEDFPYTPMHASYDPEPDIVPSSSSAVFSKSQVEENEEEQVKKKMVDFKKYHLPRIERVLDPVPSNNGNAENVRNAKLRGEQLIRVLDQFDIKAHLVDIHIGPSVTQFEVQPDSTVKVSRILGLTDNIKMSLEARDIRIEAPIPGHNAVGIEIPNEKSTPVKMRELITSLPEKDCNQPLVFVLGKDLLGRTTTCRIDKMPHLLIAGATGSGKSVCMNSIICSLLLRTKPDEVKMLLIDPKKVEFTPYKNIPHLIGPVINDAAEANNALKVIVRIMDERYNIFAMNGVRNIAGYHAFLKKKSPDEQKRMDPMPYIVVIIDELADLMLVAGKDVEASIQRITQLARAAGIHLIVATQRPSTDVITGIIKANIPSRIAFSVSSGIDSRTILDHVGAERLLGNGDMLYMPIGQNSPIRIQGVFVTDEEVERIANECSSQGAPFYDDAFIRLEGVNDGEGGGGLDVSDDPLYAEVKDYVIDVQKASTSLLQRRFGIGYNRAARMIDELESTGIIGPVQGSKPRDVYVKRESHD